MAQDTTPQDPGTENMSIASELIAARTAQGMTQGVLADVSGVSRSAIKAYESGRNMPGSRELKALCATLKVTPNKLLFGTEDLTFSGPKGTSAERMEELLRAHPEEPRILRAKLAALAPLLTHDETQSLLVLVRGLVLARHGKDKYVATLLHLDRMLEKLK